MHYIFYILRLVQVWKAYTYSVAHKFCYQLPPKIRCFGVWFHVIFPENICLKDIWSTRRKKRLFQTRVSQIMGPQLFRPKTWNPQNCVQEHGWVGGWVGINGIFEANLRFHFRAPPASQPAFQPGANANKLLSWSLANS